MDYKEALKAKNDLDMLAGRGKHANPGNICWGDGIFAQSLVTQYGCSIAELQKQVDRILHVGSRAERSERAKRIKRSVPLTASGRVPVLAQPTPKPGHDPVSMRADIALLIRQLQTEPHLQDKSIIWAIAKKYGIKEIP